MPEVVPGAQATDERLDPLEQGQPNGTTFGLKGQFRLHGGVGFTWEYDCHLFYRRAKLLAVQAGAPKVWKEKLVSALERKNAA